jgi:N-acetylglucosaminyl-diphospho-decaprenol L-rhamnosyltransferase
MHRENGHTDVSLRTTDGHQTHPPDVTVSIVSHGHYHFLAPCLRSLYAATHRVSIEVALVDNVRQPEVETLVRTEFPQVRLLVNKRPLGFAENNNQIILSSGARHLFLLNPDTILQDGAVDELVAFMDSHPSVGACGPKLIYPDGRLQLSCRELPTIGSVLLRRTPLRRLLRNSRAVRKYTMADWDHGSGRSVGWLFGAAILIRREALQAVGGLDDGMFLYSEDVDWCLRCHQAGWDVFYVPDAVIIHALDDQKYNRYFSKQRLLHYQSMLRFYRKHWRTCLKW